MADDMFELTMRNGGTFRASRSYLEWRIDDINDQICALEAERVGLEAKLGLRAITKSMEPQELTPEEAETLDKLRRPAKEVAERLTAQFIKNGNFMK